MIVKPKKALKGGMHLASGTTKALTTSYDKITGTWTDGIISDFSIVNSELVCNKGGTFLFNGHSSLSASKAGKVEYALYVNDVIISGSDTPQDFASSAKNGSIGITSLIQLNTNDRVAVYAKADDTMTITIALLKITFWGE